MLLSANVTSECVDIHLVDDEIVEANETFLAHVEQVISSDDLVFGLSPEFTNITIVDDDGKIIWMYVIELGKIQHFIKNQDLIAILPIAIGTAK